ncbi:MAG: hypothetical protein AAGN35_23970 [Bacteroidota bacterium]
MDNYLYIILVVVYVIFYVLRTIGKNAKDNRPVNRPDAKRPQTADPAPKAGGRRSVFDILRDEIEGRPETQSSPPPPTPQTMTYDPFVEQRHPESDLEHDASEANHFSEDRLIAEFEQARAEGRSIRHYTHDYFDPNTDKLKGRREMRRAKTHPMAKLMRGKKGIRNAVILREIIDRPEY